MKRSEMLNKMIVHMSRKDWQEPDMDYKEYMDKLLTMMENEGILPPLSFKEDIKLGKLLQTGNNWEEE